MDGRIHKLRRKNSVANTAPGFGLTLAPRHSGIMTLSIMTLSIMTLSIMGLFATIILIKTQHNAIAECQYAKCLVFFVMLSAIMLNAVVLSGVAP